MNDEWSAGFDAGREGSQEECAERVKELEEALRLVKHNYEALARHVRQGTIYRERSG